jgi:hypothetical protein
MTDQCRPAKPGHLDPTWTTVKAPIGLEFLVGYPDDILETTSSLHLSEPTLLPSYFHTGGHGTSSEQTSGKAQQTTGFTFEKKSPFHPSCSAFLFNFFFIFSFSIVIYFPFHEFLFYLIL